MEAQSAGEIPLLRIGVGIIEVGWLRIVGVLLPIKYRRTVC